MLPQATTEWLRVYKIPAGKPPNKFAFEGQAKDKSFASRVVAETHDQWRALVTKKCDPSGVNWLAFYFFLFQVLVLLEILFFLTYVKLFQVLVLSEILYFPL